MSHYLRLMKFDFRLYFRDGLTIFWLLIYPVIMLLLFGSMFGDLPGESPGSRYIDVYVPALCILNVISVSVFTLNINMVTLRESGVLRRFRVTPISSSVVLFSHAIQGLFLVLMGAFEIIIIAKLVWNIDIHFISLLLLVMVMLIGCVGFFSLGFALSAATKSAGAASGLAMVVFFPALFLSGIVMPLDNMPQFMQAASQWIPMSYLVNLAQGVWTGNALAQYGMEFIILIGFAIVCTVLALRFFRWE